MKLNQIAFAVAALAAGAAQASVTSPAMVIYMDGATAVKNSVTEVSKAMCSDAAHTQVYVSPSSSKINGVYCSALNMANVGAGTGLTATSDLFIIKNNVDGSLEAFDRAIKQNAQTKVIDETTCPAPTFSGTLTCGGDKFVNANGGFSDVEGKIWQGRGQFDPSGVSFTTKAGFAGQGFGVVVTDALYQAMQAAQGLTVGLPANPAAMTASDLANQPTITKQQFTAILNKAGAYHNDWQPIVGAAGTAMNVNLCRRVIVSGTQAGMDTYFLHNPCAAANPTFGKLDSARATDSTTTFHVTENAGTGDVKTCLTSYNDGATADQFAIGIASLENVPGAADHWKYVKLDGISPNEDAGQRQSVVDGRYNYAFESVYVYRNDAATNSTQKKALQNNFIKLIADPTKVNPLVGIFTVPGTALHSGFPNRVHLGTTFGNSCSPFQLTE